MTLRTTARYSNVQCVGEEAKLREHRWVCRHIDTLHRHGPTTYLGAKVSAKYKKPRVKKIGHTIHRLSSEKTACSNNTLQRPSNDSCDGANGRDIDCETSYILAVHQPRIFGEVLHVAVYMSTCQRTSSIAANDHLTSLQLLHVVYQPIIMMASTE